MAVDFRAAVYYLCQMSGRPLERQIEKYCAWYRVARGWTVLQCLLFGAAAVGAVCVIGDKLFDFGWAAGLIVAALVSVSLLTLLVAFAVAPRKAALVGYLIDKHGGLKNLVSSGLSALSEPDEVAAVVVARAERTLGKLTPRRLIPFKAHWTGRFLYLPALALLAALLMPRLDLLGRKARREKAAAERVAVQQGALKLSAKLTSIKGAAEVLQSIESRKIAKDFDVLATDLRGMAKQDALLKLGEFESKYREEFSDQRNFEQAAKALQATPDMKGLTPGQQEQLKNLIKNLNEGNAGQAGDAMRELAKELQSAELSPEQKQALAQTLAQTLDKMQGSPLSKDLAHLLREMAASSENLDQLLKQCESACDKMGEFADFCSQCEGLKAMKEGLGEAKQAMLGDSFSGFDAAAVEQYLESQACLGGDGSGPGTGGEGKGRGGAPLENKTDTGFKSELSPSKINKGTILHQLFVAGVPEKGDALAEYVDVVRSAKQLAAGSLARDQVPREYETMVKTYFDSLEVKKESEGEGR
jgi:hypothetical protein